MKGFIHRLYSNALLLRNTLFPSARSSYMNIPLTDSDETAVSDSSDDTLRDVLTIGALFVIFMLFIFTLLPSDSKK
ncbi:MAG: hypothetical protein IJF27_02805 [Oscillospiraceae bacterium]|nr:hypothetical protein [Oscillospiraceae bacterium]MBQ3048536.1 hypothetical protein [Oscillospiraceae bacterium]MBQ9939663.1 hypothetical protein [Oscillospiraceae bacterium]